MRLPRFLGPALFVLGAVLFALGFARGEASLSLVVIIPVITATGALSASGILLMVLAFVLSFLAAPWRPAEAPVSGAPPPPPAPSSRPGPERRWGGVLFLGPIPVVFGSDPGISKAMLVVAVAIFLALVLLTVFSLLAI